MFRIIFGLLALGATCAGPLVAQTDYRNLDDGRPVASEDAWPIEYRAFELLAASTFMRTAGGTESVVTPELGYGLFRNAMIGVKLPVRMNDGSGLAGPRAYAFYNFNAESPTLPGIAVRADVAMPGGRAAGERATVAVKAIATRSWGRFRTHLNLSHGFGSAADRPAVEAAPRWGASLAGDLISIRHSTLLLLEVRTAQHVAGSTLEWTTAAGVRHQLTPTLVLDGGVATTVGRAGGNTTSLTFGLSHTFAIAALWSGGAP
ncbi:MAG: hypothetical protein ABJC19_03865 [Gemmatimonadota bacterium]